MTTYPQDLQTLLLESIERAEEALDRMKAELTKVTKKSDEAFDLNAYIHDNPTALNLWDIWCHHLLERYCEEAAETCDAYMNTDKETDTLRHSLTPEDLQQQKNHHRDYLRHLLSSPFPSSPEQAVGFQRGKRLFLEGWPVNLMLKYFQFEWQTLQRVLPNTSWEHQGLRTLITDRLIKGLHLQWQAYQEMESFRWTLVENALAISHPSFKPLHVPTMIRERLGHLCQKEQLLGIVLMDYRNNDPKGQVLAGDFPQVPSEIVDITALIHRIRNQGQPLILNGLLPYQDTSSAFPSRAVRSLGIWTLPSHGALGSPALLVYSLWPGYFINEKTQKFWHMLSLILSHYVF
ncbi:hypothetical protein [Sulfobacillus thermosulfidooxidans]|uniref:hypothetical protein n=1 Tax=Sulfobacillus thermosulfidooxidans TaxID=28034 RepID=UPI0006B4EBB5|nr:hypothetical protein [Sulfobacillus thermosulfidooxidans]